VFVAGGSSGWSGRVLPMCEQIRFLFRGNIDAAAKVTAVVDDVIFDQHSAG
jgi:hypothetical protein